MLSGFGEALHSNGAVETLTRQILTFTALSIITILAKRINELLCSIVTKRSHFNDGRDGLS